MYIDLEIVRLVIRRLVISSAVIAYLIWSVKSIRNLIESKFDLYKTEDYADAWLDINIVALIFLVICVVFWAF